MAKYTDPDCLPVLSAVWHYKESDSFVAVLSLPNQPDSSTRSDLFVPITKAVALEIIVRTYSVTDYADTDIRKYNLIKTVQL